MVLQIKIGLTNESLEYEGGDGVNNDVYNPQG